MAEETMELRDLVGPYAGQVRTYKKHAGENALSHGFAEHLEPPRERQLSPTKQRYSGTPEVTPAAPRREVATTAELLPVEFPGREELITAGFDTLAKVPRAKDALVDLPGIGRAKAKKILAALGGE